MIVNNVIYELMKSLALKSIGTGDKITLQQCNDLSLDYEAVISLYSQMLTRIWKIEGTKKLDDSIITNIINRVNHNNERLINISKEFNFGSYKLAKLYGENLYGKNFINTFLKNQFIVLDEIIRDDILLCIETDPNCSVECNLSRECIGREYEELLIKKLTEKKMCFETEAELRSKGKPKTPDILFLIPVATYTKLNKEPVIINWIDSKAMFADENTLSENIDQFKGYNNRYGRGMVIYWHGFAESILDLVADDDMVVITDTLPEHFILPNSPTKYQ
jgi:hypothetical protein